MAPGEASPSQCPFSAAFRSSSTSMSSQGSVQCRGQAEHSKQKVQEEAQQSMEAKGTATKSATGSETAPGGAERATVKLGRESALPASPHAARDAAAGAGKAGEPLGFLESGKKSLFDGADSLALMKAMLPLQVPLALGLVAGALAAALLPALAPPLLLLLASALLLPPLLRTLLRSKGLLPIPGDADMVRSMVTDNMEGEFCVFLLGARSNAAWKLNTNFAFVGEYFVKMMKELESAPGSAGFLGGQTYTSNNMARGSHVMAVTYWRSYEHMLRFTHDRNQSHAAAMKHLSSKLATMPDIGLWHEAYVIKPGQHESLYVNCPPLGVGAASSLVPATGPRRTSRGRMGLAGGAKAKEEQ